MSNNSANGAMGPVLDEAKALVEAARAEAVQLDMLEPVSPEDMVAARETLGANAGHYAVLTEARQHRRGRPKGARNKRTDDFARYLLQFGQHPAITMMQIQATPPEVLIEASKQPKVHSFRKNGKPNMVVERMTYAEAQALRVRCSEGLLPYLESKKPVAVDLTAKGDFNLLIPGVNISADDARTAAAGEFIPEAQYLPVDESEEGGDAG